MNVTYERVDREIRDAFEATWAGATPVIYDDTPESIGEAPYFARFMVRPSQGRQIAVGGRQYRRSGSVLIEIYTDVRQGTGPLAALEEMAVRAFEGRTLPCGVRMSDVGADRHGHDGRGYLHSTVSARFEYDTK